MFNGDGPNLYWYVFNNPINLNDISGYSSVAGTMGRIAGGAAGRAIGGAIGGALGVEAGPAGIVIGGIAGSMAGAQLANDIMDYYFSTVKCWKTSEYDLRNYD